MSATAEPIDHDAAIYEENDEAGRQILAMLGLSDQLEDGRIYTDRGWKSPAGLAEYLRALLNGYV